MPSAGAGTSPLEFVDPAQPLALSGKTLTEREQAVPSAVETGALSLGQGAALIGAIGSLAGVLETTHCLSRDSRPTNRPAQSEGDLGMRTGP